jgi:Ca2+-binding RTX toxin-like protein
MDDDEIYGGDGNDNIFGGDGTNIINGGSGNDQLIGLDSAGNDTLNGDIGDDILASGAGNDTLDGGLGADDLNGGDGTDSLTYSTRTMGVTVVPEGSANDGSSEDDNGSRRDNVASNIENLTGGSGHDTLAGTIEANVIRGLAGDDKLIAGPGDDVLEGGAGADDLIGGSGADSTSYENATGPVTLTVDRVADDGGTADYNGVRRDYIAEVEKLTGSYFDDRITGGPSDDVLNGLSGFDILDGGPGADDLNGGSSTDRVVYTGRSSGVTITLAGGADDGNAQDDNGTRRDNIVDVDQAYGTPFNDTITGTDGRNILSGGSGDDSLSGLGYNDTLAGGLGADDISGGTGIDTLTYSGPLGPNNDHTAAVTISPDGLLPDDGSSEDDNGSRRDNVSSDIENFTGGHGNDTITGTSGANVLDGLDGLDTLRGMDGDDTLNSRDGSPDVLLDCDGGGSPGAADRANVDSADPAPTGCETVVVG